jgi:predicted DNA-binding ribbon-helix-helix protein
MVNCGAVLYSRASEQNQVTRGAKRKKKSAAAEISSVRATISFPPELYKTLEDIATQKKVSLAWVVREAAEQYIADKWPLLVPRKGT